MTSIHQLARQQLLNILGEFADDIEIHVAMSIDASDYLRSVLTITLGEERATRILEDILGSRETSSCMETLNFIEPQSAVDLIRDKHQQIITTILIHLKRSQTADILTLLDDRLRDEVILTHHHLWRHATRSARRVDRRAEQPALRLEPQTQQNGGVHTDAEIINLIENPAGKSRYRSGERI